MAHQDKAVGAEVLPAVSHHNDQGEAITAMQNERQMSVRDSFRFWPKAILFSFIISLAIIMEVCRLAQFQPPLKQH